MEKYYSPEEIAARFNLKSPTVRKWIREGKLRAFKMGSLWRVPEEALEEFIKTDQKESADRMVEQIKEEHKND